MVKIVNNPKSSKIDGIKIVPLAQISDERGSVLHMIRKEEGLLCEVGEIYFSEVLPWKIKAWKRHKKMTQNFAVPFGLIKLAFYDDRVHSKSKGKIETLVLGRPDNYSLVQVPPLLWYGFQGIGSTPSILANCADMVHDPKESESQDYTNSDFPFLWE
jgi:dTDP-4-dehydrorhamnose 3,5-epimerase